ncbi:phage tail assembly chaperone [Pseudomonas monsensis]|uniref:phage tail assembly chaperone n=1 Tax=Pseudomonas monsensis TaxID=2745509 RepID=UPI002ABA7D0B|nr:phage tail assembly chaperone [Pseudomonas monsensis]MDZ3825614.1 phage tail assembly chaperone [Pseudomonas monsensis]
MAVFVRFADASETRVTDEFGGLQDIEHYPHQGVIDEDDPRYLDFLALIAAVREKGPDVSARAWRDAEILRVSWLRDRHRDEVEIGAETTLTAEQYAELLAYIKALRDWPAAADFPVEASRPVVPEWVASQTP